jgi:hypothetical protein
MIKGERTPTLGDQFNNENELESSQRPRVLSLENSQQAFIEHDNLPYQASGGGQRHLELGYFDAN